MGSKLDEPPAYSAGQSAPQHPQPSYQGALALPQGAYNQGGVQNHEYYQPNPQMGYYQPQGPQGGYPPGGYYQGGYPQGPYQQGPYPPQQGGYYGQQQQGYYPQGQYHYQDPRSSSTGCLEGIFAGLACCCCLELLF